jgi:hypothetical protein
MRSEGLSSHAKFFDLLSGIRKMAKLQLRSLITLFMVASFYPFAWVIFIMPMGIIRRSTEPQMRMTAMIIFKSKILMQKSSACLCVSATESLTTGVTHSRESPILEAPKVKDASL